MTANCHQAAAELSRAYNRIQAKQGEYLMTTVPNATTLPKDQPELDKVDNAGDTGQEPAFEAESDYKTDDDRALEAALAELKALEEQENKPDEGEEPKADDLPPVQTEGKGEAPAKEAEPEAKKPVMIPKPRLDEVIGERDTYRDAAAYYKGLADAMAQQQGNAPATEQKDKAPTAEEALDALDAQRIELAKLYDDGELTAAELETKRLQLDRQAKAIERVADAARLEQIREEAKLQARREVMQASLESHAASIDAQHPALKDVKEEAHWAFLRHEAQRVLAQAGVKLVPDDPRSTMIFREKIAELADTYVPLWTGKSYKSPATTASTPQPKQELSDTAKARLKKIDLSHQQPPESGSIGTTGTSHEITDDQIMKMSDDDIANLPQSVLDHLARR